MQAILKAVQQAYDPSHICPKHNELRAFLFSYFQSIQTALERKGLFIAGAPWVIQAGEAYAAGDCAGIYDARGQWFDLLQTTFQSCDKQEDLVQASWCLAAQSGILQYNLIELRRSLQRKGLLPRDSRDSTEEWLLFFIPEASPETLAAWEQLIKAQFPIHVFALDSIVEGTRMSMMHSADDVTCSWRWLTHSRPGGIGRGERSHEIQPAIGSGHRHRRIESNRRRLHGRQ